MPNHGGGRRVPSDVHLPYPFEPYSDESLWRWETSTPQSRSCPAPLVLQHRHDSTFIKVECRCDSWTCEPCAARKAREHVHHLITTEWVADESIWWRSFPYRNGVHVWLRDRVRYTKRNRPDVGLLRVRRKRPHQAVHAFSNEAVTSGGLWLPKKKALIVVSKLALRTPGQATRQSVRYLGAWTAPKRKESTGYWRQVAFGKVNVAAFERAIERYERRTGSRIDLGQPPGGGFDEALFFALLEDESEADDADPR